MTAHPAHEPPRREPQWLTDRQRQAWLGIVRVMTTLPAALDAQLDREAGLNFFEYTVLAVLSEQPDHRLQMSDLAAVTNASQSRLSNVVKRLGQRNLLHREPDPSDGRCTRAVLSEAGAQLVAEAAPSHVRTVRELVIDSLTPTELQQLRNAHERILARLDPNAATHPARLDIPPGHRAGSP